jgi:hypothetical protein
MVEAQGTVDRAAVATTRRSPANSRASHAIAAPRGNVAKRRDTAPEQRSNGRLGASGPSRSDDVSGSTTTQILEYDADGALIQNVRSLSLDDMERLKRAGVLLVERISTSPPSIRRMRRFDLVVSSYRFSRKGICSRYLPLALDPRVADDLLREGVSAEADSTREIGASFMGSCSALGLRPRHQ